MFFLLMICCSQILVLCRISLYMPLLIYLANIYPVFLNEPGIALDTRDTIVNELVTVSDSQSQLGIKGRWIMEM